MTVTAEISSADAPGLITVSVDGKSTADNKASLTTEFSVKQSGQQLAFKSLTVSGSSTPVFELNDETNLDFRCRVDGDGPKDFSATLVLTCSGGSGTASTESECGSETASDSTGLTCTT